MEHQARWWVVGISAAFVLLALGYSLANPAFEASDEIRHYRYVRYLTLHRQLPPVSAEASRQLQAHHPPLYYALAAIVTAPVDGAAPDTHSPTVNPFWGFRYFEPSTDNKAQYLHAPDDRWTFSGTFLVVYLSRWLSMLFGLGAALMTYQLAREAFPGKAWVAIGAMALVAFNPTMLHASASVNNDMAAGFFGAWVIVEAVAIAGRGGTTARAARAGLALGLGVLSKASVLPLAGIVVVALLVDAWRMAKQRAALASAAAHSAKLSGTALTAALLVCGWWFARNYNLGGDLMGLSGYQSAWTGEADRARLVREAISGLPYAWTTFWARFDYGQIVLPTWVYNALAIWCAAALAGLWRVRHALSRVSAIVALALLLSLAGWGALMVTIPATANARLFLQMFPPMGVLLAAGWGGLVARQRVALASLLLLHFSLAVYALAGYLYPAFAYPSPVAQVPVGAVRAEASFEGAAEIVGYLVSTDKASPGDRVDITIFWKPLTRTASPLSVFVHLRDSEGIIAAQRDSYPGLGNAVTTTWREGEVFADIYRVFIPATAYAPETLIVRVGLWNSDEQRPLVVNDSDALELGTIRLLPMEGEAPNTLDVNFANRMSLRGYALDKRVLAAGESFTLTTYWRATAAESDYWAYAHVVGADGRIWAIADSIILPPVTGWASGELQTESRLITLAPDTPPGQYTLEFGVTKILDPGQERLSILSDDGHELGDHIKLAVLRVIEP